MTYPNRLVPALVAPLVASVLAMAAAARAAQDPKEDEEPPAAEYVEYRALPELGTAYEEPHREEQRVTGQKREEEPALDEDHEGGDGDELLPEARQQPRGVEPAGAERGRHHGATVRRAR